MYIEPNTNIKLLSYVPLDNQYEHTLWFENPTDQYNYFNSMVQRTFSNQYYQRVNKGTMRLQVNSNSIFNCNYMMFQNDMYNNKWFYAFINKVEYINDNVAEIFYEIDVMQTWLFNYTLKKNFVVRQHSVTDNVGDNIVGEPVNISNAICTDIEKTNYLQDYVVVIATAYSGKDEEGKNLPTSSTYGGMFSGLDYIWYDYTPSMATQIAQRINDIVSADNYEAIVSVFMCPKWCLGKNPTESIISYDYVSVSMKNDFNGYRPRNKKLLTAPYNYIGVDSGTDYAEYQYEFFKKTNGKIRFKMSGYVDINTQIKLEPVDYCLPSDSSEELNYHYRVKLDSNVQCSYAIDAYRAYMAQQASGDILRISQDVVNYGTGIQNAVKGGISDVLGVVSGGGSTSSITGASGGSGGFAQMQSSVFDIANVINNAYHTIKKGASARGIQTTNIDVATQDKDFHFCKMQIPRQEAEILDTFFDRFGYAYNSLQEVNRSSRPHWNYVQTKNIVLRNTNLPSDDESLICQIYNKGITFWKNADEVGDYSLNNTV